MKEYYAPMHTTEHILNQTMVRMFQCNRSFSNHIERKKSKCDYRFGRDLTETEKEEIMVIVNETIIQNLEVREELMAVDAAKNQFNLERLPEDAGSEIRIVKVGNYDACPCIGDHVKNTSEIEGQFKIISSSFENDVLRLRFKLVKN